MYCPNCGKQVEPAKFCPHCGGKLPTNIVDTPTQMDAGDGKPVPPTDPTSPAQETQNEGQKKTFATGIVIGAAVAVVLALAVGVFFVLTSPSKAPESTPEPSSQSASSQADVPAAAGTARYAGSPLAREWEFESAILDYHYVEDAIADGGTVTLVLAEDGSGTLTIGSETNDVSWKPNGTLSVEKEELGTMTWGSDEFKLNTDSESSGRTLSVRNTDGSGTMYFVEPGTSRTGAPGATSNGSGASAGTSGGNTSNTGAAETQRSPKAVDAVSVDSKGRQLFSGTVRITTNAQRAKEMNVSGFENDDTRLALLVIDGGGVIATACPSGDPDATKTDVVETIALTYAGDWKSHDGEHVTVRAAAKDLFYPSDIAGLLYTVSGNCELVK